MENNLSKDFNNNFIAPRYEFLWFLILTYSMITALSNWFDVRLVKLFGVNIDSGALIYPLSFLVSDMITEVYGYKHARRTIWAAFLFNIFFIIFGKLVTHLPSPNFAIEDNKAFDELLSLNSLIVIAYFIAYLVSEPINSYVIAKLKLIFKGNFMGLRFIVSTIFATIIYGTIFMAIAFSSQYDTKDLLKLILDGWIVKSLIEILGLPIFIRLTKRLKRTEKIDIYDFDTNFNPFSLNTSYTQKNNLYNDV
jgi:uncharacterized integral membrane protein (TIGR00697 family)